MICSWQFVDNAIENLHFEMFSLKLVEQVYKDVLNPAIAHLFGIYFS